MRESWGASTLKDAVEAAYFEVLELADEMRQAFDNTPEQFQGNSGAGREIAADTLEAVLQSSIPSELTAEEHHIEWREKRAGKDGKRSRPARRDNVVNCLEAALRYVSKLQGDNENILKFKRDLEIDIHNLKTIDFPGMRGR